MEFGKEVEGMRSAWEKSGLHAAEGLITDRLFERLPFVAATSVQEVREKQKPISKRIQPELSCPMFLFSSDVVGKIKDFYIQVELSIGRFPEITLHV